MQFAPHVRFERHGPLMIAHDMVHYDWRMLGPDGSTMTSGSNVGELNPDGQFVSMTGFWPAVSS